MATKGVWWHAVLWGWVLIVLVGCNGEGRAAKEITPSAVISNNTVSLTARPTLTRVPTWTPLPPTLTPLPTLPPGEAEAVVLNMLETNGGCELPCIWGITPGETTFDEAYNTLAQFSIINKDKSVPNMEGDQTAVFGFLQLDDMGNEFAVWVELFAIQGVVDQLVITKDINLSDVLSQNGLPEWIWIHFPTFVLPSGYYLGYTLGIVYPNFMIVTEGLTDVAFAPGGVQLIVCPTKQYDVGKSFIWSWVSFDNELSVDTMEDLIPVRWAFLNWEVDPKVYTLGDDMDLDVDRFMELFSEPGTDKCFSVRYELISFP